MFVDWGSVSTGVATSLAGAFILWAVVKFTPVGRRIWHWIGGSPVANKAVAVLSFAAITFSILAILYPSHYSIRKDELFIGVTGNAVQNNKQNVDSDWIATASCPDGSVIVQMYCTTTIQPGVLQNITRVSDREANCLWAMTNVLPPPKVAFAGNAEPLCLKVSD